MTTAHNAPSLCDLDHPGYLRLEAAMAALDTASDPVDENAVSVVVAAHA